MEKQLLEQALGWLNDADGLLITAGAGMGVDSGLPDFRGTTGFWRVYPALRSQGLSFEEIANPTAFIDNPQRAWGFYGHRLALYRATVPHEGFSILQRWGRKMAHGAFVFTSNVDGQFQQAGFSPEAVLECHGSIHAFQCSTPCSDEIWAADTFSPQVDTLQCLLENALPRCHHCGALARPNILMFGDAAWISTQADLQERRMRHWLAQVRQPVVVELGAGRAIATVRRFSERQGSRVIRINPRDEAIDAKHGVGIAGGALAVLRQLDEMMAPGG